MILTIVIVQLVLAAAMVWFLLHRLSHELQEAALESLQGHKPSNPKAILTVYTASALTPMAQQILQQYQRRYLPEGQIEINIDARVGGGVILDCDGTVFDFTVKERLKYLWR